jgi:uncharacterized protein (DUF2236 family)
MMWLYASLVHGSLVASQRFAADARRAGAIPPGDEHCCPAFGTPARVLTGSYREFREYFQTQLASGTITATPPARRVASVILAAPLPAPLRILAPAHRLATTRILPPRLRDEYELRWTPLRELALPLAGHRIGYATRPVLAVATRIRPPTPLAA